MTPVSLLDREGFYWVIASLVDNFKNFPPLAIVLVGMLGIGLAERSGFLPALLRASLARVPERLLSPLVVFLGVNSSLAVDAGYVVLPPIAAALYFTAGRSPLAGIAAAFAGVAGGFGANLLITGLDPMLAGLSEAGAHLVDPSYRVAATANWWLMIASTFLVTAVGWFVTDAIVEPRLRREGRGGASAGVECETPVLSAGDRRGLRAGLIALALVLTAIFAAVLVPGAPLHGTSANHAALGRCDRAAALHRARSAGARARRRGAHGKDGSRRRASVRRDDGEHGTVHRDGLLRGAVRGVFRQVAARRDASRSPAATGSPAPRCRTPRCSSRSSRRSRP